MSPQSLGPFYPKMLANLATVSLAKRKVHAYTLLRRNKVEEII